MTPVIGITAYDDEASWRNWKARAAMLPYAYVDAVRQGGGPYPSAALETRRPRDANWSNGRW